MRERRVVYRLLRRMGWEECAGSGDRVTGWGRPHPFDSEWRSTSRALWIALTGRSRRGGFSASWRLWEKES